MQDLLYMCSICCMRSRCCMCSVCRICSICCMCSIRCMCIISSICIAYGVFVECAVDSTDFNGFQDISIVRVGGFPKPPCSNLFGTNLYFFACPFVLSFTALVLTKIVLKRCRSSRLLLLEFCECAFH